ncbi:hypothetical protein M0E84_11100 [Corynebacterium sp. CCM 9186]|uniref:hypothetical protein n=1 Tax=Corynebacterium meridianum TaxID=2765363 RepID=UPI00200420BB|nr:hypothetical protein [Corynebacterium meridianum]MCK7678571.1 hypothetical protein [Corynebacterium meridianum]
MTTDGPLDALTVATDLRCDPRTADGTPLLSPGPCTTSVTVEGTTYGPAGDEPLQLLSRQIRGAGTITRPTVITTRLAAGTTGVYVDQVDTLVRGSAGWATTTAVRNHADTEQTISVSRALPCGDGPVTGGAEVVCGGPRTGTRMEAYTLGVTASANGGTAELTWNRTLEPGKSAAFRSRLFFDAPSRNLRR